MEALIWYLKTHLFAQLAESTGPHMRAAFAVFVENEKISVRVFGVVSERRRLQMEFVLSAAQV